MFRHEAQPQGWVSQLGFEHTPLRQALVKIVGQQRQYPVVLLRPQRALVERLGSAFPDQIIWGSDWPVCTLAASYSEWCEATAALLQRFDAADREAILGGNAGRIYGLT